MIRALRTIGSSPSPLRDGSAVHASQALRAQSMPTAARSTEAATRAFKVRGTHTKA
jgi:hypothetical protein